jgi:hypothetical protein
MNAKVYYLYRKGKHDGILLSFAHFSTKILLKFTSLTQGVLEKIDKKNHGINEAVKEIIDEIIQFNPRKSANKILNQLREDFKLKQHIVPSFSQVQNYIAYQRNKISIKKKDYSTESNFYLITFDITCENTLFKLDFNKKFHRIIRLARIYQIHILVIVLFISSIHAADISVGTRIGTIPYQP